MQEAEGRRIVGIDLGKRTYVMAVIDCHGKTTTSNGLTTFEGREALCKKLRRTDKVGIEAGNMTFILAKEIIAKAGCEVIVLNSTRLALIYADTKKTDRVDAIKIAQIVADFRAERLPTVPIPSDEEMARRRLLAEYKREVAACSSAKHRLHSIFHQAGITTVVKKDLASKANRDKTVEQLSGDELDEALSICGHIELYEKRIETLSARIKGECKENEDLQRLKTMPGIGDIVSFAFYSYVGDVSRFSNTSQLSSYLGLVPRVSQSGQLCHYGHITRQGNGYLRALLVQAAWVAVGTCKAPNLFKDKYNCLVSQGKGKKKVIIAIARKMAAQMWTLLKKQENFEYRTFTPPPKTKTAMEKMAEQALELTAA
jgi:transposase